MPVTPKTDEKLLGLLARAAGHSVTREELRRQRVSFIYGNLPVDSTVTRHQVESVLAKAEGEAA